MDSNTFTDNGISAIGLQGDYSATCTLSPKSLPYYVDSQKWAGADPWLIAPGTIIKLNSGGSLYGKFVANGTEQDKITFTSWRDDLVGGDTNNDDTATSLATRDWCQIHSEPDSNFNNVSVRYSDEGIFTRGARIENSYFAYNDKAIYVWGNTSLFVNRSYFSQNGGYDADSGAIMLHPLSPVYDTGVYEITDSTFRENKYGSAAGYVSRHP
jgi:hypothetical protein